MRALNHLAMAEAIFSLLLMIGNCEICLSKLSASAI